MKTARDWLDEYSVSHQHPAKTARPADAAWPFETGSWPPAYSPPAPVAAVTPARPVSTPAGRRAGWPQVLMAMWWW